MEKHFHFPSLPHIEQFDIKKHLFQVRLPQDNKLSVCLYLMFLFSASLEIIN